MAPEDRIKKLQGRRLTQAREAAGYRSGRAASTENGWPESTYRTHEKGTRTIGQDDAERYAKRFRSLGVEVTAADILFGTHPESAADAEKPIIGKAGAGPDGSVLFAYGDGNFGTIPAPANSTESTVALEVEGHSMQGIANDGWIITYDETAPPGPEMFGEPCVVWLGNGRVLVKMLEPGSTAGYFNLVSASAPVMRDQVVEQAALITNIIPRKSAQRYIRRTKAPVTDLVIDRGGE